MNHHRMCFGGVQFCSGVVMACSCHERCSFMIGDPLRSDEDDAWLAMYLQQHPEFGWTPIPRLKDYRVFSEHGLLCPDPLNARHTLVIKGPEEN